MFLSMLIASGIYWVMREAFHLSGGGVFLAVGVGTLPISGVLRWYFSPTANRIAAGAARA
jgi:hypothetical protein